MAMDKTEALDARARDILRENDMGGFTIPTKGLYPYQFNWDSAFVALGFATFDRDRAWREIETLMGAQWPNGMVPHIVFRRNDPDYFPGPAVWGTEVEPPTSGHSQPPVAASVVRWIHESGTREEGLPRLRALFPKLLAWHRWFHAARDPDGLGIIAVTHPWESGRDNSPDWDTAMEAVSTDGVGDYTRRDTAHVDPAMRPGKLDYDRFLAIVKFGREHGWDPGAIAGQGPFWVAGTGLTMILLRADRDLAALAREIGEEAAIPEIEGWIGRAEEGLDRLWNAETGAYCVRDLRSGALGSAISSTAFLAPYAGIRDAARLGPLMDNLRRILGKVRYGVPSYDPDERKFDSLRYWRGPVWAVVNSLIWRGLEEGGFGDLAERVRGDTAALLTEVGFYEYFCPVTGRGCGGDAFSWTAATWLSGLSPNRAGAAG